MLVPDRMAAMIAASTRLSGAQASAPPAVRVKRRAPMLRLTCAFGAFSLLKRKCIWPCTLFFGQYPTAAKGRQRSEEHTSELQSLMRTSYAVFCLKKKKHK